MKRSTREKAYFTTQEVAEQLMVAPVTVRQWAQKGLLRSVATPGGHRRFWREEVERFAREYGVTSGGGPYRILIVEDDRQYSRYLQEVVAGLADDIVIDVAFDGFEAGRKVQIVRPDLVLLDLMIPGLDGFAVCRQLKEDLRTRDIRILALTGHASDENIARILEAGAEVCLIKPVDKAALLAAIGIGTMQRR